MEDFIFSTHSGIRWLVVLATIVAMVWLLRGFFTSQPFDKRTQMIVSIWSGLVGLQWILGIILLILTDPRQRYHWEHAFIMTVVLAISHAYVPLKKRDDKQRYQGILASIVVALILVYVGINLLPQGWSMSN